MLSSKCNNDNSNKMWKENERERRKPSVYFIDLSMFAWNPIHLIYIFPMVFRRGYKSLSHAVSACLAGEQLQITIRIWITLLYSTNPPRRGKKTQKTVSWYQITCFQKFTHKIFGYWFVCVCEWVWVAKLKSIRCVYDGYYRWYSW